MILNTSHPVNFKSLEIIRNLYYIQLMLEQKWHTSLVNYRRHEFQIYLIQFTMPDIIVTWEFCHEEHTLFEPDGIIIYVSIRTHVLVSEDIKAILYFNKIVSIQH